MSRTSAGLRQTVCHLVHQVDHILNRENARVLEPYGVTVYQAMSLIYVADHEGERTVNQRAIERFTQLSNPERLELLERTPDPEDARSYALRTTPKGRDQAETFRGLILDTDRRCTAALTAEEKRQLVALLQKMTK